MTPYIEEIEKRFDEKFYPFIAYRQKNTVADFGERANVEVGELEHCEDDIKAFLRAEVYPSLLSKFAAEELKEVIEELHKKYFDGYQDGTKAYWFADDVLKVLYVHHRSAAEKAEEIIKRLNQ